MPIIKVMSKGWRFLGVLAGAALLGIWATGGASHISNSVALRGPAQAVAGPSHTGGNTGAPVCAARDSTATAKADLATYIVQGGTVQFDLDRAVLDQLGFGFVAAGATEKTTDGHRVAFNIESTSTLMIDTFEGAFRDIAGGHVQAHGALLLDKPGERVVVGNFAISADDDGCFTVKNTLNAERGEVVIFELTSVMVDFAPATQELHVVGEVTVDDLWALEAGIPQAGQVEIGTLRIDAVAKSAEAVASAIDWEGTGGDSEETRGVPPSSGPDVIVSILSGIGVDPELLGHYGSVGGIHAFAVGTYSCNIGDAPANWITHTNQHPVISQSMYRLKDDRFEQIGMAWVKHGFWATTGTLCSGPGGCDGDPTGQHLGPGCSDPYTATHNSTQNNMSRRSEVNAHTGYFPYPWTITEYDPTIGKRLQVHETDLDPDANPGALYFVQAHYITADDAWAGNNDNNASYRPAEVIVEFPNEYDVSLIGETQREQPAIRAWQDTDPTVTETDLHVPVEGLFTVAAKAIDLGTGLWRYSYAVQNLNSDRSGMSFSVPLPDGVVIGENPGFHDVDYHSGEIYDLTDWAHVIENGAITWRTDSYAINPNANALRFSTLYNFHFDANAEPAPTTVTIDLFKPDPGQPTYVSGESIGPRLEAIDCNRNGFPDRCDVDCYAEGCQWPCGGSVDCEPNGVPDECEPDCNGNGVADACDMLFCDGSLWCLDCNGNTILDECEPDCDENDIPDDCVEPPDADLDTVYDCYDLCPFTTPPDSCICPPYGECCWDGGGFCLPFDVDPLWCLEQGGVPECLAAPCRQGCLLGDFDGDGDLDLKDFAAMQAGFTGAKEHPGFQEPDQTFTLVFDFDEDNDIDILDYRMFNAYMSDP